MLSGMSDVKLSPLAPEAGKTAERATFQGVHDRKITANNQVAIPDLLKSVLDDSGVKNLVLMRWLKEPFLRLYPKRQFDRIIDEVKENLEISVEDRALAAEELSETAVLIQPDSQGRFVLPGKWITAMNFKDKVVFCGAPAYIKLWPAQAYQEVGEARQRKLEQLGQKLTNLLNM